MPDKICKECESQLELFNKFKVTCEISESFLRNRLPQGEKNKIKEVALPKVDSLIEEKTKIDDENFSELILERSHIDKVFILSKYLHICNIKFSNVHTHFCGC